MPYSSVFWCARRNVTEEVVLAFFLLGFDAINWYLEVGAKSLLYCIKTLRSSTIINHLNYFKRLAAEQTAALGEILGRYWHLLNLASVAPRSGGWSGWWGKIFVSYGWRRRSQPGWEKQKKQFLFRNPYEPTSTLTRRMFPRLSSGTGFNLVWVQKTFLRRRLASALGLEQSAVPWVWSSYLAADVRYQLSCLIYKPAKKSHLGIFRKKLFKKIPLLFFLTYINHFSGALMSTCQTMWSPLSTRTGG